MNKLTKQDRRHIRKLAYSLPPTFVEANVFRAVFGHQILERDPEYKLPDGTPINPKRVYQMKIAERVMVNDARKLEKIFQVHGAEGVKNYMDVVKGLNSHTGEQVGGLRVMQA